MAQDHQSVGGRGILEFRTLEKCLATLVREFETVSWATVWMESPSLTVSGHAEKEELQWEMGREVQRKSGEPGDVKNKKRGAALSKGEG